MTNAQKNAAAKLAWVRDAYESDQAEYRLVMQCEDELFALCANLIAAADMPAGWERSVVRRRKIAAVLMGAA